MASHELTACGASLGSGGHSIYSLGRAAASSWPPAWLPEAPSSLCLTTGDLNSLDWPASPVRGFAAPQLPNPSPLPPPVTGRWDPRWPRPPLFPFLLHSKAHSQQFLRLLSPESLGDSWSSVHFWPGHSKPLSLHPSSIPPPHPSLASAPYPLSTCGARRFSGEGRAPPGLGAAAEHSDQEVLKKVIRVVSNPSPEPHHPFLPNLEPHLLTCRPADLLTC